MGLVRWPLERQDSLSPDELLGLLGASQGIFMEGRREGPRRCNPHVPSRPQDRAPRDKLYGPMMGRGKRQGGLWGGS